MSREYKDIRPDTVHLDFIESIGDGRYEIEGALLAREINSDDEVIASTSRGDCAVKSSKRPGFDGLKSAPFTVEVDIAKHDELSFSVETKGGTKKKPLNIHTGYFTQLSPIMFSYRTIGEHIVINRKSKLIFTAKNRTRMIACEIVFWIRLIFYWRLPNVIAAVKGTLLSTEKRSISKKIFELIKPLLIVVENIALLPRAYLLRCLYFIFKSKLNKPIWIISDRGMAAGDNGEALFRYINDLEDTLADVYFVLSKKSPDYGRLNKLGSVLDQDSLRYKLMFLLADKIISSHADIEVTNPFLRQRYHYQDLMDHEFIFLQHGVIRHDHSGWLNRYEKNIKLFVTSAQKEYDSILKYSYGYDKTEVVLTGLPRFDYLDDEPAGKIILAPTYRRELARLPTDKNGARPYDPMFKRSLYYRVYNELIGDPRLHKMLREHNMILELYLHPNLQAQSIDFQGSDIIKIKQYPYSYKDAFREGNIMITDYSSVSFDFAYLNKPLIYYQFDRGNFFEHSLSEQADFFNDMIDGFGPVVTDHNELIDAVVSLVEEGKNPAEYSRRARNFFYKIDKDNSRRVYEAILAMNADV